MLARHTTSRLPSSGPCKTEKPNGARYRSTCRTSYVPQDVLEFYEALCAKPKGLIKVP